MDSIHLPDEILSEILSPALKVSDEAFADPSSNSQFATCRASTSAYLLVCKAWLRVATPLLYHVVVLRSKAQAAALKGVLVRNRDLGRFIRKLRVEGGYGVAMLKIIEIAGANVTDLFVSLEVWSSDNVSGLCRGLPLLNPTRVVIHDLSMHHSRNKNGQLLFDALWKCIEDWKRLTVFEVVDSSNYYFAIRTPIAVALSKAPALKRLVIPLSRFYGRQPPDFLCIIAKNQSLQIIETREPKDSQRMFTRSPDLEALRHPLLRGLVKLPETRAPSVSRPPTPVPSHSPALQFSTESVPEYLWERILHFALALDIEDPKPKERNSYLGIVQVSKKFSRLAQPHLHEILVFRDYNAFERFLDRLRADDSLIPTVRALFFQNTLAITLTPLVAKEFHSHQIWRLVNLVSRTPLYVKIKDFIELGRCFGSSLVRLEGIVILKTSVLCGPSVFSNYTCLASLSLASKASFGTASFAQCLTTLQELTLSNCDESMVRAFCAMDLPILFHFAFTDPYDKVPPAVGRFIENHGSTLESLEICASVHRLVNIFDACPGLVNLTVVCGSKLLTQVPQSAYYAIKDEHTCLETISFRVQGRSRGMDRKWAPFFAALNLDKFPSLRSVLLPHIRWPTNEHDIAKSGWVTSAERLLDHDVQLFDGQGVGWRRRLK